MTKYTAQSSIGKNFPFSYFSKPPLYVSVMQPPLFLACTHVLRQLIYQLRLSLISQLVVWVPGYIAVSASQGKDTDPTVGHMGPLSYLQPILSCVNSIQAYCLHLVMDCCWARLNLWCGESDGLQFIKSVSEYTVIWYPMVEHFTSTRAQKYAKGCLSKTISSCYRWHDLVSESQEPMLWLSHWSLS